jgi:hypothetical protein
MAENMEKCGAESTKISCWLAASRKYEKLWLTVYLQSMKNGADCRFAENVKNCDRLSIVNYKKTVVDFMHVDCMED